MSETKIFSCAPCKYNCTDQSNYKKHCTTKKHLKLAEGVLPIQKAKPRYCCESCDYETDWHGNLRTHKMNAHKIGLENAASYQCPTCGLASHNKGLMELHTKMAHDRAKAFGRVCGTSAKLKILNRESSKGRDAGKNIEAIEKDIEELSKKLAALKEDFRICEKEKSEIKLIKIVKGNPKPVVVPVKPHPVKKAQEITLMTQEMLKNCDEQTEDEMRRVINKMKEWAIQENYDLKAESNSFAVYDEKDSKSIAETYSSLRGLFLEEFVKYYQQMNEGNSPNNFVDE